MFGRSRLFIFLLMIRRPPRSKLADTLVPYTALFRSLLMADQDVPQAGTVKRVVERHDRATRIAEQRVHALGGQRLHEPASAGHRRRRSEEHTSEHQSLMRTSYAVLCLKKQK